MIVRIVDFLHCGCFVLNLKSRLNAIASKGFFNLSICFCDFEYEILKENSEEKLVEKLADLNLKIAVAESCTGGLISKKITDVPGASKVFEYGFCAYSNGAKIKTLGVSEKLLDEYTAVSKEVALGMALGAKRVSKADIAVSVTGYAGSEKELKYNRKVGVVYIGASFKSNYVIKLDFRKNNFISRKYIREQSAIHAICIALKLLSK